MRLLSSLCLLLCGALAWGDVVHLKDGRQIRGEVISEEGGEVKVRSRSGGVYTLPAADVERIERDEPEGPKPFRVDRVAAETKRYQRYTGLELTELVGKHVVLRGDMDRDELQPSLDAAEETVELFKRVFDAEAAEVLRSVDGYAEPIEVFQFRPEASYLKFLDRVVQRESRDIDPRRLELMRRQRGYWLLEPRPRLVGYQGPSPLESLPSRVAHKTALVLLVSWEDAGAWRPWWFLEGFAAWEEIEVTGACLTYSLEVSKAGQYDREGTPEADEFAKAKTVKRWRERIRDRLRGGDARDLGVLAKLSLNELVADDVIQGWSFVDWLQTTERLRDFTLAYKEHRGLPETCEAVFEAPIAKVERDWSAWAERIAGAR